ncbi:MAG: hypoxanthine/guanine phosphoribosyltransferase [Methanobacteriaceae archaeon]
MLENFLKSLKESPIIKKGEYNYFVNPITDGIPPMSAEILREIVDVIIVQIGTGDINKIDKIVCVEAMGIHLATALSLATDIPFVVIRKREYGLDGEKPIFQQTGYSKGELYINYINSGDNIIFIDDVVSTGGTMIATLNALSDIGANIIKTIAIVEKGEGKKIVEDETGFSVLTLAKLDIIDGKIIVDLLV